MHSCPALIRPRGFCARGLVLGVLPGGGGPRFPDSTPLDVSLGEPYHCSRKATCLSVCRTEKAECAACSLGMWDPLPRSAGRGPCHCGLGEQGCTWHGRAAPGPDPLSCASAPGPRPPCSGESKCQGWGGHEGSPPSHRHGPEHVYLSPALCFSLKTPTQSLSCCHGSPVPWACPGGFAQPSRMCAGPSLSPVLTAPAFHALTSVGL